MGKTTISPKRAISRWKKMKSAPSAFSQEKPNKSEKVKLRQFWRTNSEELGSSSEQEHKVNALASGAEEGRD